MGEAKESTLRSPGLGYRWLLRITGDARGPLRIAALAFVMALPAITMGLVGDDFDLALAVRNDPLGAYAFHARDAEVRSAATLRARAIGDAPWWIDPEFHQAFFRPLASLSLAVDFALWPEAAWWMHVENGLLFAAIILLAASAYRALGLSSPVVGLSTFFFAMQGAQSMTVGWLSGRNTLLANLFGFACVRLYLPARLLGGIGGDAPDAPGWRRQAAALGAFLAALFSAEGGVAALAYLVAYAACLDTRTVSRRLRQLVPFVVTFGLYWVWYRANGYGVRWSGFYLDPMHQPLAFAANLATALPIYLASQLTVPFAAAAGVTPQALLVVTTVSLIILFVSRGLWLPVLRRDAWARFLALGAVLAVVPLGASMPQDRLVGFIALGVCGILAEVIHGRFGSENLRLPQRGARLLYQLHALWAPLCFIPWLFGSLTLVAGGGAVVLDGLPSADLRQAVLINAPSHLPVHFLRAMRRFRGEAPPTVDLLYSGGSPFTLRRPDARSLELEVAQGFFATTIERVDRDPTQHPLPAHAMVDLPRLRVEILEAIDGRPTRVRYLFPAPLEARPLLVWRARVPERLIPPPVGAQIDVPALSPM